MFDLFNLVGFFLGSFNHDPILTAALTCNLVLVRTKTKIMLEQKCVGVIIGNLGDFSDSFYYRAWTSRLAMNMLDELKYHD